jgi:[pyruvate, water dikinase]-phosphate phosphotransferase / [pyruvate, water dikinase] kinase
MSSDPVVAETKSASLPTIYILSGGVGASAEQLVYTVLAQFPDNKVRVVTVGNIRQEEQIFSALAQAQEAHALVIYTFVDAALRRRLILEAQGLGLPAIDLMGPLIDWLSVSLGQPPLQQPGKYRQLHREYFDRVSAIEFTLAHDDGKNKEGWPQAEVVLLGVSRSGKTPLSVYLAVLGWKVANIPLVPQIPVPPELFALDPARMVGLTMDPEQLLVFRRQRQARLGLQEVSAYTDLEVIREELQQAKRLYHRGNFHIINMTDKTIEQGADEILRKLSKSGSDWA